MRGVTDIEYKILQAGKCPFCGSANFIEGPGGGLSQNYYCGNEACGAGFNLTPGYLGNFGNQIIRESKITEPR